MTYERGTDKNATTPKTAEIVAEEIGISKDNIIFDERIKEIDTGEFNLKPVDEYRNYFSSTLEKLTKRPPEGENVYDVRNDYSYGNIINI